MANMTFKIVLSAIDKASPLLRRVSGGLQGISGALINAKVALSGLLGAAGLAYAAKGFLDVAASFEQMETKLDALTKGRGAETLKEINAWAMTMPVNTRQAVDSFTMLQAMGLKPTIPLMQTLVDAAVQFDDDALPRIARALGQMQTLGKVSAEEINQLAEVGINARKYITEAFDMTVEEVQQAGIAIEDVIQAVLDGMDRDFGGSAKKMQSNWSGILTATVSYFDEIKRRVMGFGVFDWLKDQFKDLNKVIAAALEDGTIDRWASTISGQLIELGEGVVAVAKDIGVDLMELIASGRLKEWAQGAVEAFVAFMRALQGVGGAVAPVVGKLLDFAAAFPKVSAAVLTLAVVGGPLSALINLFLKLRLAIDGVKLAAFIAGIGNAAQAVGGLAMAIPAAAGGLAYYLNDMADSAIRYMKASSAMAKEAREAATAAMSMTQAFATVRPPESFDGLDVAQLQEWRKELNLAASYWQAFAQALRDDVVQTEGSGVDPAYIEHVKDSIANAEAKAKDLAEAAREADSALQGQLKNQKIAADQAAASEQKILDLKKQQKQAAEALGVTTDEQYRTMAQAAVTAYNRAAVAGFSSAEEQKRYVQAVVDKLQEVKDNAPGLFAELEKELPTEIRMPLTVDDSEPRQTISRLQRPTESTHTVRVRQEGGTSGGTSGRVRTDTGSGDRATRVSGAGGGAVMPITADTSKAVKSVQYVKKETEKQTTMKVNADTKQAEIDARITRDAIESNPVVQEFDVGGKDVSEEYGKIRDDLAKDPMPVTMEVDGKDLSEEYGKAKDDLAKDPMPVTMEVDGKDVSEEYGKIKDELEKNPAQVAIETNPDETKKGFEDVKRDIEDNPPAPEIEVAVDDAEAKSAIAALTKTETKTIIVKTIEEKALGGLLGFAGGGHLPQFRRHAPGLLTQGSWRYDDIPILAMGGEYIIKQDVVRRLGVGFFDTINAGRLPVDVVPRFASGGAVPKLIDIADVDAAIAQVQSQAGAVAGAVAGRIGLDELRARPQQTLDSIMATFTSTVRAFADGGTLTSADAQLTRQKELVRQEYQAKIAAAKAMGNEEVAYLWEAMLETLTGLIDEMRAALREMAESFQAEMEDAQAALKGELADLDADAAKTQTEAATSDAKKAYDFWRTKYQKEPNVFSRKRMEAAKAEYDQEQGESDADLRTIAREKNQKIRAFNRELTREERSTIRDIQTSGNETLRTARKETLDAHHDIRTTVLEVRAQMQQLEIELRKELAALDREYGTVSLAGVTQFLSGGGHVLPLRFAAGGIVPHLPGSVPGKDSVLAAVTPGEGVLSVPAMRALGARAFEALNSRVLRFSDGGVVPGGDFSSGAVVASASEQVVQVHELRFDFGGGDKGTLRGDEDSVAALNRALRKIERRTTRRG